MNKQKKLQDIYNKRLKKAKAKRNPNNKPKYVSKTERAKLALNPQNDIDNYSSDSVNKPKK